MSENGRAVKTTHYEYLLRGGGTTTKTRLDYADGSKSFKWPTGTKMSDVSLYNADLLDRLAPGESWVLVEGEKTADALAARGIVAVSLPGGAGQRDLSALDVLKNHPDNQGLVSPDNDAVGIALMERAHDHLKRIHPNVRWVPPVSESPGGDFADVLAVFSVDQDAEARHEIFARFKNSLDGPPNTTTVAEVPSNKTITLVRLWEHEEPSPREWLLPGLLPTGCTSILYGDSAMKKSYLCAHLSVCLASGIDFLGMKIGKTTGRSLWIDVELDHEEHQRRLYAISRSHGLDRPPEGLYYIRPRRGLLHHETMDEITDTIADLSPDLVILDSFTKALSGGDIFIPNQVTATMEAIEGWGASLLIDHIKNVPAGTSQGDLGPFGTAFKRHLARSLIQVVSAAGGGMSLVHKKSNFGPEHSPLYYEVTFEPYQDNPQRLRAVHLRGLRSDDPQMQGIEDNLPTNTLTNRVLLNTPIWPDTASPKQIGDAVNSTADVVSATLSKLEKKGLVTNPDRGKWTRPRLVPLQEEEDRDA